MLRCSALGCDCFFAYTLLSCHLQLLLERAQLVLDIAPQLARFELNAQRMDRADASTYHHTEIRALYDTVFERFHAISLKFVHTYHTTRRQ